MSAPAYTISEISARSPDMDGREFAEFVEDVRTNGQLVPIWIRGDEVIDGRKRLAACRQLGIEPKVVNLDPTQDAERVSRALNILRTHYSPSQRAAFAVERVNATKADGRRLSISKNTDAVVTAKRAAQEAGVAEAYVIAAKRVRRDGAPEVFRAVKAGELTLHAAKQITRDVPLDEQAAAVAAVISASEGKARHTPVAKVLDGIDPRRDRAMPNPKHEQFALAVQKVEVGAELIAMHIDAATQDVRRQQFLAVLREVRTTLTRAINALEAV